MADYPNTQYGPASGSAGGGGGGIPVAGTRLIGIQGLAENIVEACGGSDPCITGGTVELSKFLLEYPADVTSFSFQTAGQAAPQTGLALTDQVSLVDDAAVNGQCDTGTVTCTITPVGGTQDGLSMETYILMSDPTNICGGCGGP